VEILSRLQHRQFDRLLISHVLLALVGLVIIALGFSGLRRNENARLAAAMEVSQLKSNMVSLVSHEYSNVLTHLKLATWLLRDSEPAPVSESRADSFDMLGRAVEHLRQMTENFLNLNRIETGQLRLDIRPTLILSVASETLRLMQPLIDAKKLSLKVDFPPAPVSVKADPEALALIMSNLITNAIKYTNAGAISVLISQDEGPPARVLISVQDTGIGIAAQDLEGVLAGIRTEEGQQVAQGFGIGLKLVKGLVERHGSRLEVESEPGKGSRFFFYLPLASEK
jgi:signal transduction histidine kinase